MKVFLVKEVPNVGLAGQIKKVEDGFARNFLFPRKLAIEVTPSNEASLLAKIKKEVQNIQVEQGRTSQLAERIKNIKLAVKKKMHDDGKLYGAINAHDIVEGLSREGINITKSQVEFGKSIKSKGMYEVVIKLTSRLKPVLAVQVLPE